jgi:hypothetical protein
MPRNDEIVPAKKNRINKRGMPAIRDPPHPAKSAAIAAVQT